MCIYLTLPLSHGMQLVFVLYSIISKISLSKWTYFFLNIWTYLFVTQKYISLSLSLVNPIFHPTQQIISSGLQLTSVLVLNLYHSFRISTSVFKLYLERNIAMIFYISFKLITKQCCVNLLERFLFLKYFLYFSDSKLLSPLS